MHKDSLFSTFISAIVISSHFDNGHPSKHEVISHCDFNLNFSSDHWYWASFHVPLGLLCIFFGEMSIQIMCAFFKIVLFVDFAVELYKFFIYWILTSYWYIVYKQFSSPVGLLLQCINPLVWFSPTSLFFYFVAYALGIMLKKIITKTHAKELYYYVFF